MLSDGSFCEFGTQNQNFYGDWRETTKVRWLQQAWWRYLQARWGYSPNIHSWELLNEGDPSSDRHYALADEFGKFMHCDVFDIAQSSNDAEVCKYEHPNSHLVTTSFWHSFPANAFWASENYPNIDYADLHAYNSTGRIDNAQHEVDAALYHIDYSSKAYEILRETPGEFNQKPIMRGEAGIDFKNEQVEQPDLEKDRDGVWLHNFLWSNLDAGGMMEQYWWNENIEQNLGPDGNPGLHEIFADLHDFLIDIPLNNGLYVDANPQITNPNLRVVGQKDTTNNQAHLWVQHKEHTWRNVVDGISLSSPFFGEIYLDGFSPGAAIKVNWYHFTAQGVLSTRETDLLVDESGRIKLQLPEDPQITDVAVKFRISD